MDNTFLLIKHHLQETTKEETELVSMWLDRSKENRDTYEDIIRIWYHSQQAGELRRINKELSWTKTIKKANVKISSNYTLFFRIASVAAILIIALLVIINQTPEKLIVTNNTRGTVKEIILPDSTRVFLNHNCSIEYPSKFSSKERKVSLYGQSFFEVKKDEHRQFIIESTQSVVKVLGTSFDCYLTDSTTRVFVTEGKVSLEDMSDASNNAILLPGETGQNIAGKIVKKKSVDENILGWKTGIFSFQNTPLTDVFKKLEERYHISFSGSSEEIEHKAITASFHNNSLEEILEVIEYTCRLTLIRDENSVYFNSDSHN